MSATEAIGIDVGGSSIKAGVVELETGNVLHTTRVPSSPGFAPEDMLGAIADLAESLGPNLPVGVGFPAVVVDGYLCTDPTSFEYPGWKGMAISEELTRRCGRTVPVTNEADLAALAEYTYGAAVGASGTVLVLTFGTGIGSGLIRDGVLVPNIELGRLYLRAESEVAEYQTAARVRDEQDLTLVEWADRVQRYLKHIERVFRPDLVVIGGAISSDAEQYLDRITIDADVITARLGNHAGLIGAARLGASA